MESVIDAISDFYSWLNSGLYELITDAFAQLVIWITIAAIELKIFLIEFGWDVAQSIMANYGISDYINRAWGDLDSDLLGYLTFFRIPESLNIIFQALIAKFSLSVIGIGR